jgi:hypothetical protein
MPARYSVTGDAWNNISSSAHGVPDLLLEGNVLIILKNCHKSWLRSRSSALADGA